MKRSDKVISAVLAAALITAGSASCGGGGSRPESSAPAGAETTTTAATTTTVKETLASAVDISELVDENAGKLEDPNITYLGYYDIRSAADIDPIIRLYDKTYAGYEYEGSFDEAAYEGAVHVDMCAWAERIDKLQVLISSGQSPDLVDREGESFPMLTSKNVYEDLTDYIDISEPQWSGYDRIISQYEWKGKHIYYPWHVSALPTYIFYSGARFEEYGITTPRELYDNGEWDWNTFRDTMKKFVDASSSDNEVYGIYGLSMVHALTASTGTPSVGITDGKLVNNLASPSVDRAATFLESLKRDGLTIAQDGYWGDSTKPIITGNACFLAAGQDSLKSLMRKNDEVQVGFVPFPKDPEADKYYTGIDAFGYLVPKGAKNIEAAATFINTARKSKIDPDFRAVIDESRRVNDKWTDEQIEFMKSFEDIGSHDVVVELYGGLDSDTATTIDNMLIDAGFHDDADTWTVIRETNMNVIDASIDSINNA